MGRHNLALDSGIWRSLTFRQSSVPSQLHSWCMLWLLAVANSEYLDERIRVDVVHLYRMSISGFSLYLKEMRKSALKREQCPLWRPPRK